MILLDQIRKPQDIAAALQEIYGQDLSRPAGCLHVTAVWRQSRENLLTLKIQEKTPQSSHDFFILHLARARADAIITTGANLRSEPDLTHSLPSAEPPWTALQHWRKQVLGKSQAPRSAVLTSGRRLDFDHPIFQGNAPALIITGRQAARRLKNRAPERVLIAGLESPGIRSAVHRLRQQFSSQTVLVEAGPSTSQQLYQNPPAVDELMLSVYCQAKLDEEFQGGPFLPWPQLRRIFSVCTNGYPVWEESGAWQFYRLTNQ